MWSSDCIKIDWTLFRFIRYVHSVAGRMCWCSDQIHVREKWRRKVLSGWKYIFVAWINNEYKKEIVHDSHSFFFLHSAVGCFFVIRFFFPFILRMTSYNEQNVVSGMFLWMAFTFGILLSLKREKAIYLTHFYFSWCHWWNEFQRPTRSHLCFCSLSSRLYLLILFAKCWRSELRHVAIKLNYSIF